LVYIIPMPTIRFDYQDFIGVLGYKLPLADLITKLPLFGIGIEEMESDNITVEISPNRPDLFSVEGIARAMRAFFGFELGIKKYEVKKTDLSLLVDSSVKGVRPLIRCALVKGIDMRSIESLMEFQEKLHESIGQQRKRMAIGLHNFAKVSPPFTYKAVKSEAVEFVPLGSTRSMNIKEILAQHEKGIEYRHLVDGLDRYPIIVDSTDAVLSFPPIINSDLTALSESTRDCFIDVTGTNLKAVEKALNVLCCALAERGGVIYHFSVINGKRSILSPDLSSRQVELDPSYADQMLGEKLSKKDQVGALRKMGFNASQINDRIKVEVPAWRWDVLHEIDLVEDIAIGWGFDRLKPDKISSLTYGQELEEKKRIETIRKLMQGLGFSEVVTLTLSSEKDQFTKFGLNPKMHKIVGLENPISKDYSLIRISLLPNLLNSLKTNKRFPLPQQIFETGEVIEWKKGVPLNCFKVAGVKIDSKTNFTECKSAAKTNFTECKSAVQTILRQLGIEFEIKGKAHPAFIQGRCASLIHKKNEIGYFGEFHPKVITSFELENPLVGFELSVRNLL